MTTEATLSTTATGFLIQHVGTDAPQGHSTANSSPGQTERREQLLRVYDELDDVGKQRLLKFATELTEPNGRVNCLVKQIRIIAEMGRMGRQKATCYDGIRSLMEATGLYSIR